MNLSQHLPKTTHRNKKFLFLFLVALVFGFPINVFSHGAYYDVVEKLTAELAKTPDDAQLHFRLAQAHLGHEEWDLTLKELNRVDELSTNKYPTRLLRGVALAGRKDWQAAKTELDAVLQTEPDNTDALAARACVLLELQQPERAIPIGAKPWPSQKKSTQNSSSPGRAHSKAATNLKKL